MKLNQPSFVIDMTSARISVWYYQGHPYRRIPTSLGIDINNLSYHYDSYNVPACRRFEIFLEEQGYPILNGQYSKQSDERPYKPLHLSIKQVAIIAKRFRDFTSNILLVDNVTKKEYRGSEAHHNLLNDLGIKDEIE